MRQAPAKYGDMMNCFDTVPGAGPKQLAQVPMKCGHTID
jgi:hypothetical protein